MTAAGEVKIGTRVSVLGAECKVRYVRYHGSKVTMDLIPADSDISPFIDQTFIVVTVEANMQIKKDTEL